MGVNRSTYSDYEQGKTEPSASLSTRMAQYFSVTVDELLQADLDTPLFYQKNSNPPSIYTDGLRVVTLTVVEKQPNNIELVPTNAIAGYSTGFSSPDFIQDLPRFNLPGLPEGAYRAFEIQGKSMPPIHEGFIVVGRYVESWKDLKDGNRYVLVLRHEGVVFKRVVNEVEQSRKLVLCSDNPQFLPFIVSVTDILEAWEMVAYIGFPNNLANETEAIFGKLQAIEQKLNLLTANNR